MSVVTSNQNTRTASSKVIQYQLLITALIIVLLSFFTTIGLAQKGDVKSIKSSIEEDKPPFRVKVSTEPEWIQASLERHNYFRSLHKSQKLVLNKTLSEISQAWSNYLLDRAIESFSRSRTVDFFEHNHPVLREHRIGESLFYTIAYYEKLNASIAVNLWYNEIKDYDFEFAKVKRTSNPKSQIGHLTQLLWNETTQMGTAYAAQKLPNGQTLGFVTANYFPTGNVLVAGNFPLKKYLQNVFPPSISQVNKSEDGASKIHGKISKWDIPRASLTTPRSWIEAAVKKHNVYRRDFSFPEIKVNEELCEVAQSWANLLLKEGMEDFNKYYLLKYYKNNFHATRKAEFGENVMYFIGDGLLNPNYPVQLWYQEKEFYNFEARKTNETKSRTARTDHFEQVIWKGTTHMGIAFSGGQLENGQILSFVVANYFPSGQKRSFEERIENIPNMSSSIFQHNRWSKSWWIGLSLFYLMSYPFENQMK